MYRDCAGVAKRVIINVGCVVDSLVADIREFAGRLEFDGDWVKFESTYNVAPTQEVLTVVGGVTTRSGLMRWRLARQSNVPYPGTALGCPRSCRNSEPSDWRWA